MKKALIIIGLCLVSASAQAITRHDPTKISCDQVHETIAGEGAVILRYQSTRTPGLPLYDRYVSDQRFCERDEVAYPATVPTADTKSCPVKVCKVLDLDDRQGVLMP
ncbi:MAG TPA: hypothetical protein VGM46_02450 [Mesorhizobium sp.]